MCTYIYYFKNIIRALKLDKTKIFYAYFFHADENSFAYICSI